MERLTSGKGATTIDPTIEIWTRDDAKNGYHIFNFCVKYTRRTQNSLISHGRKNPGFCT